jgi:Transposase DDE domain group 1
MPTECNPTTMLFAPVERRRVAADFDGGAMTSDAGALLLGASDRAIGLVGRFASCFADARAPELVEHQVATLVGQRVFGIALGYEDVIDHDHLRHDPVMAVLAGKLAARRSDCAPLAGKSTLNRLELSRPEPTRYHKIAHDPAAIERLFVDIFVEAHRTPPKQIILDLDATDDPVHGHQEGRFFHGYYDCYCYLPLYIFCGRHLLAAKLRRSDIDASAGSVEEVARIVAQVRARWPRVRVLLRADSGFAREVLMAWCEATRVDYLFGLARNARLEAEIAPQLAEAAAESRATGRPARRFRDFMWTTLDSWSRRRRVIGKAECTKGEANPRFIVTSLKPKTAEPQYLYEKIYCARGEMENRIKECRLCCKFPAVARDALARGRAGGYAASSCSATSWTASVSAQGPSPKARSTKRASPWMSRVRLKIAA